MTDQSDKGGASASLRCRCAACVSDLLQAGPKAAQTETRTELPASNRTSEPPRKSQEPFHQAGFWPAA